MRSFAFIFHRCGQGFRSCISFCFQQSLSLSFFYIIDYKSLFFIVLKNERCLLCWSPKCISFPLSFLSNSFFTHGLKSFRSMYARHTWTPIRHPGVSCLVLTSLQLFPSKAWSNMDVFLAETLAIHHIGGGLAVNHVNPRNTFIPQGIAFPKSFFRSIESCFFPIHLSSIPFNAGQSLWLVAY